MPTSVARALASRLATSATVSDVSTDRCISGSSLTAVELGGLTKVELAFALALAAAGGGLVLGLGLAERRRTFAIARALGPRSRALGAFVYGQAAYVLVGGLTLGALGGAWISTMLVKVRTGVFDPPPSAASVPWIYVAALAAATTAAVAAAAGAMVWAARRRPIVETLREL